MNPPLDFDSAEVPRLAVDLATAPRAAARSVLADHRCRQFDGADRPEGVLLQPTVSFG